MVKLVKFAKRTNFQKLFEEWISSKTKTSTISYPIIFLLKYQTTGQEKFTFHRVSLFFFIN